MVFGSIVGDVEIESQERGDVKEWLSMYVICLTSGRNFGSGRLVVRVYIRVGRVYPRKPRWDGIRYLDEEWNKRP
jgi:hypothetical protein